MGSFLSEPVTEKLSSDEINDKLKCGFSCMQGWRLTQEDAHNCLLDFDVNTSLFAVYDGHGGHEVAQYCAQNLPQFIKDSEAYKAGDIKRALIEGFLGFDQTIATQKVIAILKEMADEKKEAEESGDDDEEENVDNLYEEAAMPIEQVIEKYTNLVNPSLKDLKKGDGDKFPKSPFLKAKKDVSSESSAASSSANCSSDNAQSKEEASGVDGVNSRGSGEEAANVTEVKEKTDTLSDSNGPIPDIKISSPNSSDSKDSITTHSKETQNGEMSEAQTKSDVASSISQENGEVEDSGDGKGKGKAVGKTKITPTPVKLRPKRNADQLYKTLLEYEDDSEEDTEDEEDKTFEGPNEASSDDDEGVNIAIEDAGSEEESSGGEEEEDEEDADEDDDDDDDGEDEENLKFARGMKEEPGSDSGCTAVVALLKGNELYVANAGDSRCIVCRNGKAVEMSIDHKPEDVPERERILKAGGTVTRDGRVNGGLNLSRAIGDFAYKQNKELSDKEQMITALPDVKTLRINPGEDEFLVLACDGIWNFMSSQEVVDFVKPRIDTCEKLSTICEEMFDHCLAPNTWGDGTGCDNMTAIIVQFKSNILKRSASPEPSVEKNDSKRAKTEETESSLCDASA